jgi:hypothetical protein
MGDQDDRKTVEEALWGYRDQHGKWTPGLVQQFSAFQECSTRTLDDFKKATATKLNMTIVLACLSLGRIAWPDVIKLVATAAQASGLH